MPLCHGLACASTTVIPSAKPIFKPINQQRWHEDTAGGVMLVGFGLASAYTRSKLFCIFEIPGVNGELGGGRSQTPS